MSRASAYARDESKLIPPVGYLLNSEPITTLVEPLSDVKNNPPNFAPIFDTCYFYNNLAGLAEVAVYQIKEQLVQHLFGSIHLTYASLYPWEQLESDRKQDIWVEMPPLSTEKVVMRTCDMGFGEPLAILDPLSEE